MAAAWPTINVTTCGVTSAGSLFLGDLMAEAVANRAALTGWQKAGAKVGMKLAIGVPSLIGGYYAGGALKGGLVGIFVGSVIGIIIDLILAAAGRI